MTSSVKPLKGPNVTHSQEPVSVPVWVCDRWASGAKNTMPGATQQGLFPSVTLWGRRQLHPPPHPSAMSYTHPVPCSLYPQRHRDRSQTFFFKDMNQTLHVTL